MLLESFHLEIINNHCMPGAVSVNGIARLDQDIGCVIPYLNTALGGHQYVKDPPAVTFKTQGRLISVQPDRITVNAVKDRGQALKIVEWIRNEINETWDRREEIVPCDKSPEKPKATEILKHLPKTNCGECREPTCLVFALRLAEGAKSLENCPVLKDEPKTALAEYLAGFIFED